MKKINILESQYRVLNEGLSNLLYHFTSIGNGYNIAKDGVIMLQSALSKDAEDYDNKRKYYLSCSRIRNGNFGYSRKFMDGGVRIELDGDALSSRFKGKPIMYWSGLGDKYRYYEKLPRNYKDTLNHLSYDIERFKKKNPSASEDDIENFVKNNFDNYAQTHISNESEDRIFSYEPVIRDIEKYVRSIDVLLPNFENDEEKMRIASDFRYHTKLGKLVRIFDSALEFNKVNGSDANDKVKYNQEASSRHEGLDDHRIRYALKQVIYFIAYANEEYEGKKFPVAVAKLLDKYHLDEFKGMIGDLTRGFRNIFSATQVIENLDTVRRDLSDYPNETTYKILKMFTDYSLSIGGKTFRDTCRKKIKISDEYNGHDDTYKRIDTSKKYGFLVVDKYTLSLNPNIDKFRDAMRWDDEHCKYYADSVAYEVMNEDGYTKTSKNYNSMFYFLYKLFRVGSVMDVYNTFKKLGLNKETLESMGIYIEPKELSYWDTFDFNRTVNTSNLDYSTAYEMKKKEINKFFAEKQGV